MKYTYTLKRTIDIDINQIEQLIFQDVLGYNIDDIIKNNDYKLLEKLVNMILTNLYKDYNEILIKDKQELIKLISSEILNKNIQIPLDI